MSELSSFYGGRQGASFIIVKKFDGLDIPDNTYRLGCFAKDNEGYFYVPLIERTADNYKDYPGWDLIPRDGTTTVTSQDGVTSEPLKLEYAEGMKQCFAKGGMSTSEVGYGEYVIIDPIFGLKEYSNPDNGKVYRRGMNYDSDLGGAEYIGQVLGPKGDSPELDMTTVENVLDHTESQVRVYDMSAGTAQDGIVPGKYEDEGEVKYNDGITYAWATVRDNYGNIIGALIGFTFPYLVPEITSLKRSPYYTQEDYDLGRIDDESLIGTSIKDEDNFLLFIDNDFNSEDRDPTHGDTGHAFYRRWKLSVPHGIKGDTQTQLEIVPQKIRPEAPLWESEQITVVAPSAADDETYVILDDERFNKDCVYPYDDASALVAVRKNSEPDKVYYAKIEDTYMLKIRYRQTNYDEHVDGSDYQMIDLGDYNTIRKVWLADDGYLWVSYNADADSIINQDKPIQWYEDVDILADGSVVFTYNTLDAFGENNKKTFSKALDWIESVALANVDNPSSFDARGTNVNNGRFRIIFNNDSIDNKTGTWTDRAGRVHAVWETNLTWPQKVSLDQKGLLKFLYNNNLYPDRSIYTDETAGTYEYYIPWITGALIEQDGTFTLTYNNESNADYYPSEEWNSDTHTWTTSLSFIDHVVIDDDGTIHFYYSNGNEAPNTGYVNIKLKYLTDAGVDTGLVEDSQYDFEGEGTGSQKIEFTWNTESTPGEKDTDLVGAPLNYIMEAVVTTYDEKSPNTPQNHLLVLYSDPAYRAWLAQKYPNKIFRYTSQKFTQANPTNPSETIFVTRNDWFDLGYVKGEPGGLHIIGQYELAAGETYQDYLDDNVPPEDMPGNTPEDRGWAYLIVDKSGTEELRTIYTYDYKHSKWVVVSDLSAVTMDPTQILILDTAVIDPVSGNLIPANSEYERLPKENGLWFIKSEILAAY